MSVKEEYIEFCQSHHESIPIFYQPWWLDIVSENNNWDVILFKGNKDEIIGLWPFVTYRKYIFNFILQPVLTPYLGPLIFYPPNQKKTEKILSFEKKVFSELIKQIPKASHILKLKLSPEISNWLPFFWLGFKQTTHYTYQLDLQDLDKVKEGYSSSLRSSLKSVPNNISIIESQDASLAFDLAEASYSKQNANIYFSKPTFLGLDKGLAQRDARQIFIAYRNETEPIGCVYIFYDRNTAYLPIIGRGQINKNEDGVTKLLIDHSIEQAAKRASIYDFEGSMFPQFERVFRSYGAKQTPYHVVSRVQQKILQILTNS